MADATPTGETGTPAVPKTDATNPPVPAPPVKQEDNSAVEQLRKELEMQQMRANQLANQLKAKEEAEAAAKSKELEEQNEFKTLYEQERAKREGIESELEEKEQKKAIADAKAAALSEYSEEVRVLADEAGMDLASADDTTVAAFKERLEKISKRVGASGRVTGNNPSPKGDSGGELSPSEIRKQVQTDSGFHDLMVKKFPGIAAMTDPKNR